MKLEEMTMTVDKVEGTKSELTPLKVLMVEDSPNDCELIVRTLTRGGFELTWKRVETEEEMSRALELEHWDIVTSDYTMPRFSGLRALKLLGETGQDIPCIVISGTIGEEVAVETMKAGANDYVMKDRLHRLAPAVERELREAAVRRKRVQLEKDLFAAAQEWRTTFDSIKNPIVLLDANGVILRCNRAFRDLAEKPYDEILGHSCFTVVDGLCRRNDDCPLGKTDDSDTRTCRNFEIKGRHFEGNLDRILDDSGECVGFVHALEDVTERRTSEMILRDNEDKYRQLAENSADVILTIDLEGQITYLNRAGLDLTGYSTSEIEGTSVFKLIPPEYYDDLRTRLEERREGEQPRNEYELELVRKSGSRVPIEVRSAAIVREGRTTGVLINATDLSHRRAAEAELSIQRSLVEAMMENIPDQIYFKDTECRFIRVNRAQAHILGVENPADAVGKTDFDYFTGESARLAFADDNSILTTGEAIVDKEELETLKGRPDRWVSTTKMPLTDSAGKLIGTFGISHDITEKKQLVERLADLAKFPQENPDPVLRVGGDGQIRFSNPAASVLVANPDFCRDGWLTDEWRELASRTTASGVTSRIEQQVGKTTFRFVMTPLAGRDYLNIYASDVTETKTLERMLLQSSKLEAMGQLAGGVAHEFNNMMTVVNAYSDILILKLAENAPLLSYATKIKETGKKASSITDQLLVFARKDPIALESVDIGAALSDLEKMLGPIVGKHLGFSVKFEPTIGHVRMDPVQIDQIVMNLVINARDALNEEGTIRVEAENREVDSTYHAQQFPLNPGRYIALRVADNGTGISPEIAERIFEPFFTTKSVGKGTGLGLAVIYKIVKDNLGDIRVSSGAGIGTTFEILLPRDEAEPGQPSVA